MRVGPSGFCRALKLEWWWEGSGRVLRWEIRGPAGWIPPVVATAPARNGLEGGGRIAPAPVIFQNIFPMPCKNARALSSVMGEGNQACPRMRDSF